MSSAALPLLAAAEPVPGRARSSEFLDLTRAIQEAHDRTLRRLARVESELARANERLRENVAQLTAVLQAAPVGIVVSSPDGTILRANRAAARILGVPEGELEGRSADDVRNADGHCLLRGECGEREVRALDGREVVLSRTRSDVRDAAGAVVGAVDLLDDRTELRRLERRGRHREKLAALGEMSATVAHEVRNPLHAIEGFASLILRTIPDAPELAKPRTYASHVVRGVHELNGIVSNLLEFSRPDRFAPVRRDVARVAARAADLVRAGLPAEDAARTPIEILPGAPAFADVDEIQLLQAIRNLVANAAEAMPRGGVVRIAVTNEGGGVAVRVTDEGEGVRPEVRARIFAPFFTTKARGTGLGLAVVAKAAAVHGGSVSLEPAERGASFRLWLPSSPHHSE